MLAMKIELQNLLHLFRREDAHFLTLKVGAARE
jgi:hypothetical protein